jgi:hypothetical protein
VSANKTPTRAARDRGPSTTQLGILALAAVVILVAIVLLVAGGGGGDDEDAAAPTTTATTAPTTTSTLVEGMEVLLPQEHDHVEGTVDYDRLPPVGGDHHHDWQNCGVYREPVENEYAVHSLEHGAVWITYDPDLPADQVEQLEVFGAEPYMLLSPWGDGDLPAPIVASAWGLQLQVDDVADVRLTDFMQYYRQAPTAPEPSAPCTGGVGEPVAA